MRSLSPINMTEKGGGKEMEKKRGKKKTIKKRADCTGTNRVSTLVFRFYVEKCVSATNAPLKKRKQI